MNFGWYEIMDRISVIQNMLEDNIRNHQEGDEKVQELIDSAQELLSEAYQYAARQWDESCRDFEDGFK